MAIKFGTKSRSKDDLSQEPVTKIQDSPEATMSKKVPLWLVLLSIPAFIVVVPILLRVCVILGRVLFRF